MSYMFYFNKLYMVVQLCCVRLARKQESYPLRERFFSLIPLEEKTPNQNTYSLEYKRQHLK